MECKNCGNIANGFYCPHCAQKTKVDRITFRSLLEEISDTVFQINKGFLYTIKELFVRPGHTIREYLEGKRKNHFKPIAFVFTLSTIYFFISRWIDSDTFLSEIFESFTQSAYDNNDKFEGTKALIKVFKWLTNNYAYTILTLLPLYSLASYFSFLGTKFNYLEHLALNAYISGQQAIIFLYIRKH